MHGHSASMEAMDLIADEPTQFNIPEEQVQSYFIRADSERPSSRHFDDPLRRLGMCTRPVIFYDLPGGEPRELTLDDHA